jgi:spore maturation protein CgeB
VYSPQPGQYLHDVSFVGGGHPWRSFVVSRLRKAGISVYTAGPFWPAGTLSTTEMVRTFSRSRINLNLANGRNWDIRYLLTTRRALRTTLRTGKVREGIKARHFEIAGSGGFQLSYYEEDLERHFQIGEEIAVYIDVDDLVEKVRYFLSNDAERERIAAAGLQRARAEHTAERRMRDLLVQALDRHGSLESQGSR